MSVTSVASSFSPVDVSMLVTLVQNVVKGLTSSLTLPMTCTFPHCFFLCAWLMSAHIPIFPSSKFTPHYQYKKVYIYV